MDTMRSTVPDVFAPADRDAAERNRSTVGWFVALERGVVTVIGRQP
jgi:hypothetical protein